MNIFVLNDDPYMAAADHCDKHVVKMILESCQLLSTALTFYRCTASGLYKPTHLNHPCSIWVRESRDNYLWLCDLTAALLNEYDIRYGLRKGISHKSVPVLNVCAKHYRKIPYGVQTKHPKCMPDEYISTSVVKSYRNYYIGDKSRFAEWRYTKTPSWFSNAFKEKS
jgi:hypothetical protein